MSRRRAKSKVHRAPYRGRLEQLLREDKYTLDEMVDIIRAEFPEAEVSRSGLHRYEQAFQALSSRMREIDRAASSLVGEFGDSLGEKASTLLANAVVTLVTDVALRQQESEEGVDVDTARKLARAAKDAIDTKRVDVNVRKVIAAEARERALREAATRIESAAQARGLSGEDASYWRDQVLAGM